MDFVFRLEERWKFLLESSCLLFVCDIHVGFALG